MPRHDLVVKQHRPWRQRLLIGGLAVMAVLAILYSYHRGLSDGGYLRGEAITEQRSLQAQLQDARTTKRRLRERVAILERAQEVDREARERVRQDVMGMQDEILQLREELTFYRGIVSPEDGQAGIAVQNFSISPGAEERLYHYRLMLIQALRHDRRAQGRVELVVRGRRNGQAEELPLSAMTEGSEEISFSFRYFQDFEGSLRLPDGFEPREVELTVVPGGRGRETLVERFEWPGGSG
jgi:hypothetical protein